MNDTAITERIFFAPQIPISEIDANSFKKAIKDKKVECSINGVRVNNLNSKRVNLDISFKILEDINIVNPGTSITGKPLYNPIHSNSLLNEDNAKTSIKGKNVTLRFKVKQDLKTDLIEVMNEHEVYTILENVFKSKGIMNYTEKGSIILYAPILNSLLREEKVYLTTIAVLNNHNECYLEVNAAMDGETQ